MKDFHYFVSHALGWATGADLEETIEKLWHDQGGINKWLTNARKAGEPGLNFFCCRVPLPEDANYRIEWYCPKVEGITECQNRILTYYSQKKIAHCADPKDEIRKRKDKYHQLKKAAFNLSYSVARSQSIHDDSIQSSQDELRPFVDNLFEEKES